MNVFLHIIFVVLATVVAYLITAKVTKDNTLALIVGIVVLILGVASSGLLG